MSVNLCAELYNLFKRLQNVLPLF